jgi:hypothetical protein
MLFQLALVRIATGEKGEAFVWLEKAIEAGAVDRYDLCYARQLDPLKNDSRFEQILSRHEYTKSLASGLSQRAVVIESVCGN